MLLLSAHTHNQRHFFHDAANGWHGAQPLHEYNVGAACGAFWSGAKDARGIPDTTMSDGTPNGYAWLTFDAGGEYSLRWQVARASRPTTQIALHAPQRAASRRVARLSASMPTCSWATPTRASNTASTKANGSR